VDVTRCPTEQLPSIDIQYGELAVGSARLRTIVTSTLRPRAMILVIQGIACESIEGSGGEGAEARGTDAPLVGLVHGLACAGYDTFRIDKHGVGDSDGGPCNAIDFETEVAGFAAALAAATDRARALAIPLVVFGHSVGGIIAARLASAHVAAIVTYGAPASPWLACLVETTRRQMALRGVADATIERAATELADRAFVDGLNGRTGAYHRQLDAIDPVTLWSAVTAPVLVVRGEFDWVVRADDQARIATLVGHGSTIIDLPDVDHVLGWHPDQASSLRDYGAGRFDPRIVPPIVAWLDRALIG
jgi:pimeloyl-ACP methyl ester carboxylesterase